MFRIDPPDGDSPPLGPRPARFQRPAPAAAASLPRMLSAFAEDGDPTVLARFLRRWQFEAALAHDRATGRAEAMLPRSTALRLHQVLDGLLCGAPAHSEVRIAPSLEIAGRDEELARFSALTAPVPLLPGPDPSGFVAALTAAAPHLGDLARAIGDLLALSWRLGDGRLKLPPLLLVGPPGCGKSWAAQWIAGELGAPSMTLNAGGSTDSRFLLGTPKGWASAQPSAPARLFLQSRVANPLMIVEELDKAGGSDSNGRIHDALLTMIEPATSRRWLDEYLLTPLDLSHMGWIFTANDPGRIPAHLLSRMLVLQLDAPAPAHLPTIVMNIGRAMVEAYGGDPASFGLSHEEMATILEAPAASLRTVQRTIAAVLTARPVTLN